MKAVVLTFDHLPARFLGCYGNEDASTPQFDRLAAASTVFDFHFADNVDPGAAGHAWWTGRYQFPHARDTQRSFRTLPGVLEAAGVKTLLVAEPRHSAGVPAPPLFGETAGVSGRDGFDADEDETPFFRLIAAAERRLEQLASSSPGPALIWLRSRGVPQPSLPPRPFLMDALARAGLLDEEADGEPRAGPTDDQQALESQIETILDALAGRLASPRSIRDEIGDPGEFHVLVETARAVYAGSVALLDEGLGRLRAALERCFPDEPLLFLVTAALGRSLGETLWLGARRSEAERGGRLVDEVVHTPLFAQVLPGVSPGRSSALVQSVDLAPTLLDWFGLDPGALGSDGQSLLPLARGAAGPRREFICLGDGLAARAIRTEDFLLVSDHLPDQETAATPPRLYVQPDDRWQVNDVAAQSPDEVARLESLLDDFVAFHVSRRA